MTRALAESALELARAFARGNALWCIAPGSPHHAHHVAVEFVHPIVVGARALPATAVASVDVIAAAARPGDVVVVIGPDEIDTGELTTIRIAADPEAVYDGNAVRAYHVLWELTQICLEHPGLLVA